MNKTAYVLLYFKIVNGGIVFNKAGIFSERHPTRNPALGDFCAELSSHTGHDYGDACAQAKRSLAAWPAHRWVLPFLR
jgi:hypothetical protein